MAGKNTSNYTKEQTIELVDAYTSAQSDAERVKVVQEFAEKWNLKTRNIIMKLTREKVYVKPQKVSAREGNRKSDLVESFADMINVSSETIESLEKATKGTIETIINKFKELQGNS